MASPCLANVLDNLTKLNVQKTVVVVGAAREQITSTSPNLTTAVQHEQLGTGHAVRTLCQKVDGAAALAVLGFRPGDPLAYGRLATDASGQLLRIVEHADASDAERQIAFCNSGILAGQAEVLFDLLSRVSNDNAKSEYYLTDVVSLTRAAGYHITTAEADPLEVTGVNSKEELAALNRKVVDLWFDKT